MPESETNSVRYKRYIQTFLSFTAISLSHSVGAGKFDVSGFARLVAGTLSGSDASYFGYEDDLSIDNDSLFALQANYEWNPKWSATVQGLVHTSDTRESGIEWAYLTYQPNNNWQFKLGRLRTPLLNYSDVRDVGLAFPWVRPPQQVYDTFLFSNYEGISITRTSAFDNTSIRLEGWFGYFDGNVPAVDSTVNADLNRLGGANATVRQGNLEFRISYTKGSADVGLTEINQFTDVLRQVGFDRNADDLTTSDTAAFLHGSISYDNLRFFSKNEFIAIRSSEFFIPDLNAAFTSFGYYYKNLTAYATLAFIDTEYTAPDNEIPLGLSPELDALSLGFDQIVDGFLDDDLRSLSLGLRWDILPTLALKTEIIFLDGEDNERSFFINNTPNTPLDNKGTLSLIALDWVF
jgi:hypothetical protein